MDDGNIAAEKTLHRAAAKQRAIPVDHRGEPAGPGRVGAIDFQVFISKACRIARGLADKFGSAASLAAAKQKFRQPGQLEEKHVPRPSKLDRAAQFAGEAGRVRQVENHQAVDELRLVQGKRPSQRCAPVVGEQQSFARLRGCDQRGHVINQRARAVGGDFARRIGCAVAAQVGRPHAIAQAGQQRHLMSPGVGMFGEPVKAERQAVAHAHGGDLKVDAIGGHANEFDARPVHAVLAYAPQHQRRIL